MSPANARRTRSDARPAARSKRAAALHRPKAAGATVPLDAEAGVREFVDSLDGGSPWFPALLDVIARWVTPEERVDGAVYHYLLEGEAFDWLRLAERLLGAADGRVPPAEAERLLMFGEWPEDISEESFARAIGHQKYRGHLNFVYGVAVEEALQWLATLDLEKSRSSLEGPRAVPTDVAAYERIYGRPLEELLQLYRNDTGMALANRVSQSEHHAFTYWCWKYRVKTHEPARVASDTRRALALLSRMSADARERRRRAAEAIAVEDVIEIR